MRLFCQKKIIIFLNFILFSQLLYSQSSMPSVSMPSVTSPTLPQMPSFSTFPSLSTSSTNNSTQNQNQTGTQSSQNTNTTEKSTTSVINEASMLSSFLNGSSTNDVATLSSLLGNNYSSLQSIQNAQNANSTNLLLQQVLEKIEKLETPSTPIINQNGKIIRFWANGQNLLNSISDVYFSKKAEDGSFFLTAQLKSKAGENTNTETFYISVNKVNSRQFSSQISLIQQITDETSLLFQIAKKSPVESQVTGNLVSIKINNENLKADILLDISEL